MNRRFFVFRFFIEVKIPRRIVCRLMIPDQISTRFSHDSGSGAVHHQMQLLFRVSTIQLAQKREELLTAMLRYPGNSSVVGCVWTGGGGILGRGGGGLGVIDRIFSSFRKHSRRSPVSSVMFFRGLGMTLVPRCRVSRACQMVCVRGGSPYGRKHTVGYRQGVA